MLFHRLTDATTIDKRFSKFYLLVGVSSPSVCSLFGCWNAGSPEKLSVETEAWHIYQCFLVPNDVGMARPQTQNGNAIT